MMYGNSTPTLRKVALKLVSQCVSSSGCERNWSTFALVHTKVRNRLTHKKLHKLVYVNYNLRLRLKDVSDPPRDEGDFISQLAHLSFYDEKNPIRDWMEYGRSNKAPVLDEDDDDGDVPLPNPLVSDQIAPEDLRAATGAEGISDWARQHVGDSHLGKRKLQTGRSKGAPKPKRGKGKAIAKEVHSDEDTTDDDEGNRSPEYAESNDSSSADDGDGSGDGDGSADGDGDGDGDGGGGGGGGAAVDVGGGGAATGPGGGGGIRFTGINCTYILITFETMWMSTIYGSLQVRANSHMPLRTEIMVLRSRRGQEWAPRTTTLHSTLRPRIAIPHSLITILFLT
jgi:uncharacterized membrane protein YgcG